TIVRIVQRIFPDGHYSRAELLPGGLRNSNYKVSGSSGRPVVLRIFEHEPEICMKEIQILELIRSGVPVPELLYAQPNDEETGPFIVLQYVEGITFHELRRTGDSNEIAETASSVGETLAALGRFHFPSSGR